MSLIESLQHGLDRVLPRRTKSSAVPAVGIGNGRGMANYEDDVSLVHPHFRLTFLFSALHMYVWLLSTCASETILELFT